MSETRDGILQAKEQELQTDLQTWAQENLNLSPGQTLHVALTIQNPGRRKAWVLYDEELIREELEIIQEAVKGKKMEWRKLVKIFVDNNNELTPFSVLPNCINNLNLYLQKQGIKIEIRVCPEDRGKSYKKLPHAQRRFRFYKIIEKYI